MFVKTIEIVNISMVETFQTCNNVTQSVCILLSLCYRKLLSTRFLLWVTIPEVEVNAAVTIYEAWWRGSTDRIMNFI